jgi:hypothetical protein
MYWGSLMITQQSDVAHVILIVWEDDWLKVNK